MIHQEVTFSVPPERVYALLTDGKLFAQATGGRAAEIGAGEGARFSLFGGAIHGRHVELVSGARVVQAWRAQNWPEGHYSIVRFTLTEDGAKTKLVLDHTGYPDGDHDHLSQGWAANYFEPFAKYFA
jgi:activator of HSP90 ATPase